MHNGLVDATKDSTEDEDKVKLESGTETLLLSSLLFAYQSDWQKHLLSRYVNELVLSDYLQKTRYALPLFFFVFKTNIDYQIGATFVTENKKRKHYGSSGDYQKLEFRIISSLWDDRLVYRRDKYHGKCFPRYEKYSFLSKWSVFG